MSTLQFRIITVPRTTYNEEHKNRLLADVKRLLQYCDLEVESINFFQIVKSEEEDHPEIEELILQVQAKVGLSYPKQKLSQYESFLIKWKEQPKSLPCSYIGFYANDSFSHVRRSRTEINWYKLSFGVLPHDGLFHQYADIKTDNNNINFYHDTRNVTIKHNDFEISFSYDNIRNVIVNIQTYPSQIFFDLFNPPIIHRLETRRSRYIGEYTLRHRNLNLQKECSMNPEIDADILGRANVLHISFFNSSNELEKIISNIHFRCSEKLIFYSSIAIISKNKPTVPPLTFFTEFNCLYLMTAIFKRNFILMEQSACNVWTYLSAVVNLSKQNPKALEKALTDILLALDSGKFLNYWSAIENRFHYYVAKTNMIDFKEYIVPPKCCLTRRITMTPTRQLLWPPEILFGNRVVRNFDSEFAIRVSFRDDNMQRLSSCATYADSGVLESCIKNPMTSGIPIGSRHYEFLAWSNSQIRDHGVWMYARDSKGTVSSDIRRWMGDFSHIHNVPKYMARMGQCFSQTEDTLSVPLSYDSVRTVPDIERGYDPETGKPYCFSDGVGRMSSLLAAKVHVALGHDKLCSAFQIRYGGYKGMLVVDPTLKNAQIVFRDSMKKFDCPNSTTLEIARTSAPVPLQLNRPFIAILNDLGVRHRVFLRLQEDMLKEITDMLFDEEKAAESLKSKTPTAMYNFKELSNAGIHLTTEPMFRNVLLSLHRHQINCLKSRANVSIDPNYGRNMLGVLDETGILKYGEIFAQYSTDISFGETTKETTILKGEVLVTKNPCHFPGDVRKFQAVDVPSLHHIVDCIVFPQNGPRPHPSEMAGSDQDGDEFTVLWLPELLFHGPNRPAAHFPSKKLPDNLPNIGTYDMVNFLQEYITNDQIGMISHAHLAFADKEGIDNYISRDIARKCSIAVDFPKTGMVEPLSRHEKPNEYPDFMEKNFRGEYKSEKALGKMYRICKDFETENEQAATMYQDIKVDPDLKYPGWERYEKAAVKMRNKYNSILGSLLRNYGIEHESEVISGAFTKLHCRFQERKDRMEIQKVVVVCFKKLKNSMLEEFMEEFSSSEDVNANVQAIMQKASAWYVVTYSDPDAKFLSFPWTVFKHLCNIKIKKTLGITPPFSPAITELDEKIVECESQNLLPDCEKTYMFNQYEILCEPLVLERALRVLIVWAQDEEIIELPNQHEGLLYTGVFVKLFLHVAELNNYIVKKYECINNKKPSSAFSPGKLCVEFLKFCSSLRFYNKNDIHQVLPFNVYKYSKLAKRAVISYHRFALSGIFRELYFDRKIKEDLMEMKPFTIESRIFAQPVISELSLKKAEEALVKYSKVNCLRLREHRQTKKVWVWAQGSERSLKELKAILRKKHVFLTELFNTGVMPETAGDFGVKRLLSEIIFGGNTMEAKRMKF